MNSEIYNLISNMVEQQYQNHGRSYAFSAGCLTILLTDAFKELSEERQAFYRQQIVNLTNQ